VVHPSQPSRRAVLRGALAGGLAALMPPAAAQTAPVTGLPVPDLASFDDQVRAYMEQQGIPGGALAVVRRGRLVLARGYGYAALESKAPVQPTSLFRIASVSKPITGMVVAKLLAAKRDGLTADTPAVDYVGLRPYVRRGETADPRIRAITLRHLLQHSAGWDRAVSGDLMFRHFEMARDLRIPSPPDHRSLLRWGLGRPLDFDPGSRYAYSNFGYCLLGRVIEKAVGRGYEEHVSETLLRPLGITRMRIGNGRRAERLPEEVVYHQPEGGLVRNVHSGDPERQVAAPYGFASPRTMDAHGGWVASAVDLARLVAALDHPRGAPVLTETAREAMLAPPPPPLGRDAEGRPAATYYAYGWNVRPVAEGVNFWHAGGMPGTSSLLVRLAGGNAWAVVFNKRPAEGSPDAILQAAAAAVTHWPEHDLFDRYFA
jgi:CubicO group peptidase (beta-lactamase class C family)